MIRKEWAIQGGQTLVGVVDDDGKATLRIAKDGHNRGVAKLEPGQAVEVEEFLHEGAHRATVAQVPERAAELRAGRQPGEDPDEWKGRQ